MTRITINDLEVYFHVGVPHEERARPQRLLITIEMEFDFRNAAETDEISATIDYHEVSQEVISLGTDRHWKLIESLANDVADLVLKQFKPAAVTVAVKKFVLPQASHVSVSMTKQQ